jgi:hypothetical protein
VEGSLGRYELGLPLLPEVLENPMRSNDVHASQEP